MYSFFAILGLPGGWEVVVIILAIVLLFGGKKIPELAKGLGQGIKEFKKATHELTDDDSASSEDAADEKK